MEKMSPELQKLIDKLMQQSFSLESTLAEGLGSTLSNQRFAVDQMLTLARMFTQMGMLSEQGMSTELDEKLQTLLTNYKEHMTEGEGKTLEPAMLHKLAFQMLEEPETEKLPENLQFLLMQQGMANPQPQDAGSSESLGFMKQLMQYFMPTPQAEESYSELKQPTSQSSGENAQQSAQMAENAHQPQQTDQPQQTGQPQQSQSVPLQQNAQQPQQTGQPQQGMPFQQNAQQPQQTDQPQQTGRPQQSQSVPVQQNVQQPQQTGQPQQGVPLQQNAQQSQQTGQPQQGMPFQQNAQQSQQGAQQTQHGEVNSFQRTLDGINERIQQNQSTQQNFSAQQEQPAQRNVSSQPWRSAQQMQQQQMAKNGMTSQNTAVRTPMPLPMQNTPQTMETMRQMASLLLKDATLTEQDTKLLSDFVNNQQGILSEKEAKELQLLLQLCEKNVPASVRQLAQRQGMENLPRLWAFMELCDVSTLKERDAKSLKKAGKNLSDFASMMKHSMGAENARTSEGHRSMSFMTPLYMGGDQQKPYPAYIHVYDEEKKEDGTSSQKETWLRICLLTENIGAVDASFRMYEETNVDVRIFFSERENIAEFREYMDEFRASFNDKPLTLMDVKLGVAGAKYD